MNKGDWDGAIAEYHKALEENPKSDLIHDSLADALVHKGDLDGAVSEYKQALRLNPSSEASHSGLAAALGAKQDWNGAMAEDREVLRLNPNNDRVHTNLGDALRNNGNWNDAVVGIPRSAAVEPKQRLGPCRTRHRVGRPRQLGCSHCGKTRGPPPKPQ